MDTGRQTILPREDEDVFRYFERSRLQKKAEIKAFIKESPVSFPGKFNSHTRNAITMLPMGNHPSQVREALGGFQVGVGYWRVLENYPEFSKIPNVGDGLEVESKSLFTKALDTGAMAAAALELTPKSVPGLAATAVGAVGVGSWKAFQYLPESSTVYGAAERVFEETKPYMTTAVKAGNMAARAATNLSSMLPSEATGALGGAVGAIGTLKPFGNDSGSSKMSGTIGVAVGAITGAAISSYIGPTYGCVVGGALGSMTVRGIESVMQNNSAEKCAAATTEQRSESKIFSSQDRGIDQGC